MGLRSLLDADIDVKGRKIWFPCAFGSQLGPTQRQHGPKNLPKWSPRGVPDQVFHFSFFGSWALLVPRWPQGSKKKTQDPSKGPLELILSVLGTNKTLEILSR